MSDSSHLHRDEYSDHQHDVAWDTDNESFVGIVDFDYDSVDRNVFAVEPDEDRDTVVSFADMAAALALIANWACASPNITHVGGRIAAIGVMLDPVNAPHGRNDLATIARECGVTRAAISKWMCDFRDQVGTSLTLGKRRSSRAKNRAAQIRALERGTHSSFTRKDNPTRKRKQYDIEDCDDAAYELDNDAAHAEMDGDIRLDAVAE